jgi:hypothetical protein
MIRHIFILSLCAALGACATTTEQPTAAADVTFCEDPRPQVCTMDYRPVCATLNDGSTQTYSNGCGACADAKVVSWIESACPE